MLKTAGIPMWATIFALIVFLLGCVLGLMAMFGQSVGQDMVFGRGFGQDMKPWMSISWGGRHVGLGLAAGVAVLLKSPTAYIAAFVGGVGRDVGDLIAELGKSEPNIAIVAGIAVFLIAGVVGIIAANKARNVSNRGT
jgi:hypothetical protein